MADDIMKQDHLEDNAPQKKAKAIALLSGGLDSNLAVRLMLEQGVDVEAVAVKTPFCDFDCGKGCGHRVKEVADDLNVPLKTVYFGQEYLRMLKRPKFGLGSGMNPCLDCRSLMYSAAKQHMETVGADFIVTGEVLFQRPMSQNRHALEIIEKETGTEGKVLRPLSAKCLPLTEVEKSGYVKRDNLFNITGRSRKAQLALAKRFEIANPPNSAGGCLLTDPQFSIRIRDLMEHMPDPKGVPTLNDVELLKVGRHFRLSSTTKLIVGRNEIENEIIWSLRLEDDLGMQVKKYPGPSSILRGCGYIHSLVHRAAQIALRYSDCPRGKESSVEITFKGKVSDIVAVPSNGDELETLRI
jgi:tRNA U34 2-thiouridine synthase MnmA/TrmU